MSDRRQQWIAPILLALSAGVSCSGGERASLPLAYAPAESPYVLANLQRGDGDLPGLIDAVLAPAALELARLVETLRSALSSDTIEPELQRSRLRLLTLVEDKFSVAGWERVGFRRDALFALYGFGLSPVLRIELADAAAARTFVDELIDVLAIRGLEKLELLGHPYWRIPLQPEHDVPALLVAIPEQHLVLALDAGGRGPLLGDLLGLRRPDRSMQQSAVLTSAIRNTGFGDRLVGLIDSARALEAASQEIEQATWWSRELARFEDQLTPSCTAELAALVEVAPRFVIGFSQMDRFGLTWQSMVELRADLARQFATIAAPVPGVDHAPSDAPVDLAFGLHLGRLAEVVQARATAIRQSPFACAWFDPLNSFAEKGNELAAMLYAGSTWMTGFRLVVSEAVWTDAWPERLEAALVIATPNERALLAMVQGIVPGLSELSMERGAQPVQVDPDTLGVAVLRGAPSLHVAVAEGVIGIATGEQTRRQLLELMHAPSAEPAPWLRRGLRPAIALDLLAGFANQFFGEDSELVASLQRTADGDSVRDTEVPTLPEILDRAIHGSGLEFLGLLLEATASVDVPVLDYAWDIGLVTERGLESRQQMRLH